VRPMTRRLAAVVVVVVAACGPAADPPGASAPATGDGGTTTAPASPSASPSPAGTPAAAATDPATHVLLAAGDIAWCGPDEDDTGRLLERDPDAVVAPLGDLAYDSGTPEEFERCYLDAWGHALDRTRPAPGNHDAVTAGLAGYFGVFGDRAGEAPAGFYSYDVGDHWHAVVLNSNCTVAAPCGAAGAQVRWLERDLGAAGDRHVVAYWHHPRFSSGRYGDDDRTAAFWDVLHAAGADIVLAGHEHDYERFTTLDPDGAHDPDGIRQFVVGTGGAVLREFPGPPTATTEARESDHHGILRLELEPCGYRWQFVTVDAGVLDDGAHTLC
jgi:hypothetical protein